jgi:signal transduction histidine kinase
LKCPAFVVALLLALAANAFAQADERPPVPEPAWRVVLIRNWDAMYPVNVMREQAMRQVLIGDAPRRLEIYTEELDPLRFPQGPGPEYVASLAQKYRGLAIDLVIASGLEPLEFATRHRDELWPGTAIVFNGVIEGTLDGWTRPPRTAGLTMILDVEGTLKLGLSLVPQARKVYLLTGTADFDRRLLALAQKAVARLPRAVDVEVLSGLTQDEMGHRLSSAEPDAIAVYLTVLRDGAGNFSGPGTPFMRNLAARSRPPLFVSIHTQFGRGGVGGSSSRFDSHGRAAGVLARSILEGRDPDSIPIRADPAPWCQVDWRALKRGGLADRNVPSGCEISNAPPGLWGTYFWQVLALVSIIVLQAALLWALAMQSSRRRKAEAELQLRSAEMARVARVSMVGALTASIAHEINQPMGAILSNAEAARMMLDQGTLDNEKLREILTDIRDEDLRASAVIRGLRALLARSEWHPIALELNTEVAEALRHVAFDAARRGVRLAPIFDNAIPTIRGDATQLQQVVINLVLNAMDAVTTAPQNLTEIRIETRALTDGAEVAVADHGPGLAPSDASRVFQTSFTTKKDGMGFGLSIVRAIVEMHGGRVSFEPNVPRGAVFRVWLPAIGA